VIFVTVGTQLPFDRLVRAIDAWAGLHPDVSVFAQIGANGYRPKNFACKETLSSDEIDDYSRRSELIVSHVGMGSILTALRFQKRCVVVPRKASLREHRNEHQLATAKWLAGSTYRGVTVVWDEQDLGAVLDARHDLVAGEAIDEFAEPAFLQRLATYIAG
jgi:UDP-N-acetylglucosamine transferase subunit ALG13